MSATPPRDGAEPIRDRLRRLRREPARAKAVEELVDAKDDVRSEGSEPLSSLETGAIPSVEPRVVRDIESPSVPDARAVDSADIDSSAMASSRVADAETKRKSPREDVFSRLGRRASAATRVEASAASSLAPIPVDPDEVQPAPSANIDEATGRGMTRIESAIANPAVRELSYDPPRSLARGEGGAWARVEQLERTYRHGSFALEEVLAASRERLAERARDERLLDIDLERAVFLDTETTGLSGGAGTYVFLVGLGRFTRAGFELWQGFLPHPADEKTLLNETAARIFDASLIISFFGKSFDRHRLEDKMRLHGVAPPFEARVHLDLYHPLRRAHRGEFENCRLKTLERELVHVARGDDLPGSFAPAAWFDFLGKRPHRLEGVFRHNREDVLSLVSLAAHLAR